MRVSEPKNPIVGSDDPTFNNGFFPAGPPNTLSQTPPFFTPLHAFHASHVTCQAYDMQLSPLHCISTYSFSEAPFSPFSLAAVSSKSFVRFRPFQVESQCAVRSHGKRSRRKAAEPGFLRGSDHPRGAVPVVWNLPESISTMTSDHGVHPKPRLGSTGVMLGETGLYESFACSIHIIEKISGVGNPDIALLGPSMGLCPALSDL